MKDRAAGIGAVLCTCGGKLFSPEEIETIGSRVSERGGNYPGVLVRDYLCLKKQLASTAQWAGNKGLAGIVFACCSPVRGESLMHAISQKTGIPSGNVRGVDVSGVRSGSRQKMESTLGAIDRAIRSLSLVPRFQTRRISLDQKVLIVGNGEAAAMIASALRSLGHPVVILESSRVQRVDGQVGGFSVTFGGPTGNERIVCGAIVLATDALPTAAGQAPYDGVSILPLSGVRKVSAALPRRRQPHAIGLVLDYRIEETVHGTEQALTLALDLLRHPENGASRCDVHLFCRDIRVSAMGLENLYDQAREAGLCVVKYDGLLTAVPAADGGAEIRCRDSLMGADRCLRCSVVGVSAAGVSVSADPALARIFGVTTDSLGQLQPNNVTLFPGQTNRPGIFAVGPCRGQQYMPRVRSEADATAVSVHSLLSPGYLDVELSQPVVDPDKCVLCLTCVRSCPHKAMAVDHEKGTAGSSPEACQRCGICVGECPARAIELPAYSERALLSLIG